MIFKSFEELNNFKKNSSKDYSNYNLKELLSLPSFSGIYNLKFDNKNFNYINIGNDDGGILKFFWQGEPELLSMKIWTSIVNEKNSALDIGANTGRYSVIGGKFGGDIISFEPYNINFCRLVDNLKLNNLNYMNSLMIGLSDENKNSYLNIKSPLYYKSAGGKISNKGLSIRLLKLDNIKFNKPINIMKVDVEGHEFEVINGSKQIINNFLPYIIIEYNVESFNKVSELLIKKLNYNYFFIDDKNKKIINIPQSRLHQSFNGNIFFYKKMKNTKVKKIFDEYCL